MDLVSYSVEGSVGLIEINRPPVNALSADLLGDMDEAISLASDAQIRAVVITGRPHFAAGADLKGFKAVHEAADVEDTRGGISRVARRLEQLPKPVIAAIHGYALGGGLELAMGADFLYLADDAAVGQAEILIGIIPGAGGTQRLQRFVGFARAKELIFSGRQVGAEEAQSIGLAQKVVPADELLAVAMNDAATFAEGPTKALAQAKKAMNEGWGRPIDEALAVEAQSFADCFDTDDAREGIAAFVEKRKAEFTGS